MKAMRVYLSGIGGVGIGPLAEISLASGAQIVGSDLESSPMTESLENQGVKIYYSQTGEDLRREHSNQPIDWFVYTSALPDDHPELAAARELGIRTAKRDELLAEIIDSNQMKLIAVAGTHGKTTTTSMLVWALEQLGVPISYSVGAKLSFGPSGKFIPGSEYFIYECDEFDRNFLHFSPFLSIITSIGYDHSDTYPSEKDYKSAFEKFMMQSDYCLLWEEDLRSLGKPDIEANYEAYDELMDLSRITLAGLHNRQNAFLVERAVIRLAGADAVEVGQIIKLFPGVSRRFERIADGLYSDYGHHPDEIAATLQMASELSDDVVLVYQPHQNVRQHEIRKLYTNEIFAKANRIYWLPTYLSREDPNLEILSPEQLTSGLEPQKIQFAEMNDDLWAEIQQQRQAESLMLCMGAGSIDGWVRKKISKLD